MVPKSKGCKTITYKWEYKVKLKCDSTLGKCKSCVVAKGYKQKYRVSKTYSPMVKPQTIRVVLTISLTLEWDIRQLDTNNDLLNGELVNEMYIYQSQCFEDKSSPYLVCELKKVLYGLKQAPKSLVLEAFLYTHQSWFSKFQGKKFYVLPETLEENNNFFSIY